MTILNQNYRNDQSQFEKALEEAKKQMSEIRFSTHVS